MNFQHGDKKPEYVDFLLKCNFICHKPTRLHSQKHLADTIAIQMNMSNIKRHI